MKKTAAPKRHQGMNWIRPAKRLAIYLRDGLACVWCGTAVETGEGLTLDHLRCYSHGGGNEAANLVTSCRRCNSSRGTRSVAGFARVVAEYLDHGVQPESIVAHIGRTRRRTLDMTAAHAMMARRG